MKNTSIKRVVYVVALVVFASIAALASNAVAGDTIKKEQWIDSMTTLAPNTLCATKYLQQCYSISEDECIEEVMRAAKICLKKNEAKMPAVFNQPKDGEKWGEIVGECTGDAAETQISIKHKKNPAKCNIKDY
ncbi:MAG: hypothetical protein L7F77_07975 [Candidatus Magnetominusculus sp. LBB02]|nr:hypothetical protein [Candidatus Magnetominusculus sp. LBB02]